MGFGAGAGAGITFEGMASKGIGLAAVGLGGLDARAKDLVLADQ